MVTGRGEVTTYLNAGVFCTNVWVFRINVWDECWIIDHWLLKHKAGNKRNTVVISKEARLRNPPRKMGCIQGISRRCASLDMTAMA